MLEGSQLGLGEEAAALLCELVLLQFDPAEGIAADPSDVLATF